MTGSRWVFRRGRQSDYLQLRAHSLPLRQSWCLCEEKEEEEEEEEEEEGRVVGVEGCECGCGCEKRWKRLRLLYSRSRVLKGHSRGCPNQGYLFFCPTYLSALGRDSPAWPDPDVAPFPPLVVCPGCRNRH